MSKAEYFKIVQGGPAAGGLAERLRHERRGVNAPAAEIEVSSTSSWSSVLFALADWPAGNAWRRAHWRSRATRREEAYLV